MNRRSSPDIETQRNKEKCEMLLKLSPKIRFVSIINEFGSGEGIGSNNKCCGEAIKKQPAVLFALSP